ncbi:response regulator [Undibacterium sp. Jales W-56]|uniref:HD domain-containing phosphohydrolase n=1 Tax=Undibacterium sp. Jales W-56 TaxID=2897325 RepID=UPI0021CE5CBE|nr:HD domain-containing phosphohydrolase [Undibacterium sp. Jales W-56]MCU6433523.1 response regulator [Undibacterium sp. Jales W-56]
MSESLLPDQQSEAERMEQFVQSAKILCVDDEPNILSSLRRLFRAKGYKVLIANSGQEGLAVMETEAVDLVISDMRMPEMDGAQFLEKVRSRWPDTLRLLLTGYADVQAIIDAINRGEIYRYITKPWDDNDIMLVVRQALERKALESEKRRLEALTLRQNDELKELNHSLEAKVEARTAELKTAHDSLVQVNDKLKSSFLTSIKVFSNLIEMRGGKLAGRSRRVADLARKIAVRMGCNNKDSQEIFVAGLLVDIGKIGFSDEMLNTPVNNMSGDELGEYHKHTVRAEQLLLPLEDLQGTAKILRSQHERFDGTGFPDGLPGDAIPLGARILALASDYDSLQTGSLVQRRLPADEAQRVVQRGLKSRYDENVVNAFNQVMSGHLGEPVADKEIAIRDLQAGMILSTEMISRDGVMLLPADHILTDRIIEKIRLYDASNGGKMTVRVRTAPLSAAASLQGNSYASIIRRT